MEAEGCKGHFRSKSRRGIGNDGAINVDVNTDTGQQQRSTLLTSIILRHILTWYSLFFSTKKFPFLRGLRVSQGWGAHGGQVAIPLQLLLHHVTLSWRGGFSIIICLISLFSILFSNYSHYPFFLHFFDGMSLCCPHTIIFLYFAPLISK